MKKSYFLRRFFASCAFGLLLSSNVNAQFANKYVFSASSGAYTPLVSGTATSLSATSDDGLSSSVPIGFNFVFNNQSVSSLLVSSNGVVMFNTTGSSTTGNDLATTTASQRLAVAPLWDDLQCSNGVTYELSGTAPNRVMTIEFKEMEWAYSADVPVISFQVKLYETTNVVEFVYQQEPNAYSGFSGGASIGIMGSNPTDFISLQDVTAAPDTSITVSTNDIVTRPATGQVYTFTPPAPPAAPPTPSQASTPPDCINGTELILSGAPGANNYWYWQSSATGTSTTSPHVAPHYVLGNGTYYVRTYNNITGSWSSATSIVVSNFTYPPTPPAPTAAQNPACSTTGTDLSEAAAPTGEIYYWQGTSANGTSTANDAASTYAVSTTGTYYVRSQDTSTMCWSTASASIAVTIGTNTSPDAPTANPSYYNYCASASTMDAIAQVPIIMGPTTCNTSNSISGYDQDNLVATVTDFSCATNTVTSASLDASMGPYCAWWGDYSFDIYVNGNQVASNQCDLTGFDLTPYLPLTSVSITGHDDDGWQTYVTLTASVTLSYSAPIPTQPNMDITWYDAATGGTQLGTGTSIDGLTTSVIPSTTPGTYSFYAETNQDGCPSPTRTQVDVNITDVLAVITAVDVTCNGMDNGTFLAGSPDCGTAPLTYSVDGSAYGAIPTDLTPGNHTVILKDAVGDTSAAIIITIAEPSAPTGLDDFNVTFYNGYVTWTAQGNETSWNVEYGPAGFTPGTGTMVVATNDTLHISGLTESTDYEFYVQAGCTSSSDWAGPHAFRTIDPFYAYDNQCGPGFIDISSTGTNMNLTDDSEGGITLPWSWDVSGTTVNTITVGNNGGILFNTLTGNVGYTATGNGFFPFCQDLNTPLSTGGVFYESIGTAPNRQFIVLWKDIAHYTYPASTDGATFEVIYDEASGEAYFIYEDVMMGNSSWDYGADADIMAKTTNGAVWVSSDDASYLMANSCVHFYNSFCPNIENMVVLTYPDDAQLNWDAGQYGETNWTLVYGPEGFDPTVPGQAIDTLQLTSSDTNFGNTLTQLTGYDVYIYSECQADNLTSSGYFVHFVTKPWCADITGLAGVTDPDSLELTWNWTEVTPVYPVTSFDIEYGMYGFQQGTGTLVTANGTNFADTVVDPNFLGSGVYQVYVQAICAGTTDSSNFVGPITVIMPATNDIVCSQEALMLDSLYTFNTTGASVSPNETNIAPPATGAQTNDGWANSTLNGTLWYTFVAPASGQVRINSTAIDFNSQAAVYEATLCGDFNTFSLISANDDAIEGGSSAPNFTACGLTPGQTYYLMFDKFNSTNGNFAVTISEVVLNAGMANPTTNVCSGDTINLYNTIGGYDMGGNWSSAVAIVNSSINDSLFSSTGIAYTTFNFEYRVVDGCAFDTVVSKVRIYGPSNAGEDGNITACKNEPIDLLSGLHGNTDLDGDWYDPSNTHLPNSQVTTGTFPGQYNYDYISGNGVCPDDTANVVVTVTSCDWLSVEEEFFTSVNIYPNPTSGIVNIQADASFGSFDIKVSDVNGRTIATIKGIEGVDSYNLSAFERGTYFFEIKKANSSKVYRVVLQ